MSFLGLAANQVVGDISAGLIRPQRGFGGIVADVTVTERHNDRLTITQHPVEKTASITDHAYKEPPTVTIRCGWTSSVLSTTLSNIFNGNFSSALSGLSGLVGGVTNSRPTSVYQQLLAFQNTCRLLDVYTGKRKYSPMLLAEIEVITDQDTEYALIADLTFQYVILVETTTVTVPPNNVQANPASTGSTTDNGPQNAAPVANIPSGLLSSVG